MWKLYLDDERTPRSDGWVVVRTPAAFKLAIFARQWDVISFDHDLGDGVEDGYQLMQWMYDEVGVWAETVQVHSANPAGAQNMESYISFVERHMAGEFDDR